jgi:hypothetical protein
MSVKPRKPALAAKLGEGKTKRRLAGRETAAAVGEIGPKKERRTENSELRTQNSELRRDELSDLGR